MPWIPARRAAYQPVAIFVSTATTDAPDSVRIQVSPNTLPFQRACEDGSIRSATSPRSVVESRPELWWDGISASINASASPAVNLTAGADASGSSRWYAFRVRAPSPWATAERRRCSRVVRS